MSLRKALNEHCKACIYDPHSGGGTWRQQVEACTISRCSLWEFRLRDRTRAPRPRSAAQTENDIKLKAKRALAGI